ncbi:hypothetical protein NPX13_g2785 [Xylaria arbuscula]|uniref:Methyltransferase type 12 domain-containing protein n=1 Tax=Xylaria arbuscula TaxID=114810 RepID=A0A9W8NJ05_9PEZI|nr:hypothetical protein NPX13_g2785 [Xylaria arbuscula]
MSTTNHSPEPFGRYTTLYSPTFLSIVYDFLVHRFNMRTDTVLEPFFAENFSRRHLDVGVATGYFLGVALARPFGTEAEHHITLVDLNPSPLKAAKARVLSKTTNATVETVVADVTEPPPELLQDLQFDSITMFNLFHCVPGKEKKLEAISLYKDLLADDGVLAGCTILGERFATNRINYLYLKLYNNKGIFHNWDDKKGDFERALMKNFKEVETTVVGMMLLFRATKPRRQ